MIEVQAVSRDRLVEANRAIARWTRLSGTPEEREAAEYVAGELRTMGYKVRILDHDAYISLPGPAALRITSPEARDVPCITHSMGVASGPDGVRAELVYAGKGEPADYARADAAGKFALVEGRATPWHAVHATRAGVTGLVCISGPHPHEMCVSPIWGNPSETTVGQLPRVILVSVSRSDGQTLRELCHAGRVEVHVRADVRTGWTTTPIVEADLAAGHPQAEPRFVMLSGHLDSWYLGAMDNGSANAAMLEVARIMAQHRKALRRGLRVLFWFGHSHGRYSSSAWYADTYWTELHERCVVHVNTDSLGGVDADHFGTNSMPETVGLAAEAVRRTARARLDGRRVGRNSDQSFLGIGIPSILGSVSRQADGSLGWWWHTPHDTLDKIDPARLVRDTRIFVHVVGRWLTDPVLPLDYAASAADIRHSLDALQHQAAGRFDLQPAVAEAARLMSLCRRLRALQRRRVSRPRAEAINRCLVRLGRILIPVTYTAAGRHAHDPALEQPFLPRLAPAARLATMAPGSDAEKFLLVDLVRARSALVAALRQACAAVEGVLEATRRAPGRRRPARSGRR
ncbi:MAG: M28 family peptidase [Armatimonadota bacterium]|nr:M28 family peptidase [Armatimonadota bacterium]